MRIKKIKKVYSFHKKKEECGSEDWAQSKQALAISQIQMDRIRLQKCIHDNFVCLIGMNETYIHHNSVPKDYYCQFIKQKSQLWMELRNEATVTGSTAYNALGLGSLT